MKCCYSNLGAINTMQRVYNFPGTTWRTIEIVLTIQPVVIGTE